MSESKITTVQLSPHVAVIYLPDGCSPGRSEAAEYFAQAVAELATSFPSAHYQYVVFDCEKSDSFGGVRAWLAVENGRISAKRKIPAIFRQKVGDLPFGSRTMEWLKAGDVETVSEIVADHLPATANKTMILREIDALLATQGLRRGMTADEMFAWTPPNPVQPLFKRRS